MILNPATHRLLITPTPVPFPDPAYEPSLTIGDYAIEYAVLDGLNVIDIGLKSGLITFFNAEDPYPGQNDVTPAVAEGQRLRIMRVWMRSFDGDAPGAVLRCGIGIQPIPPSAEAGVALGQADLRFSEQMVYSDGRWTIYDVTGLAKAAGSTVTSTPPAPLVIPFHADASANLTLTSQAVAQQFLGNSNRNMIVADLDGYTECKLVARVITGSASVNTPRLLAKYNSSFSTTVGDYADLGTSEVACSLANAGVESSGWIPLAAGAIDTGRTLTVTQIGGNASASPALGMILLHFR